MQNLPIRGHVQASFLMRGDITSKPWDPILLLVRSQSACVWDIGNNESLTSELFLALILLREVLHAHRTLHHYLGPIVHARNPPLFWELIGNFSIFLDLDCKDVHVHQTISISNQIVIDFFLLFQIFRGSISHAQMLRIAKKRSVQQDGIYTPLPLQNFYMWVNTALQVTLWMYKLNCPLTVVQFTTAAQNSSFENI